MNEMGMNEIKGIFDAIISGDKRYQKRVAEKRIYALMGLIVGVDREVAPDKQEVANALYHIYTNLTVIYDDNEKKALNYFIVLTKLVFGDNFDNDVIMLIYHIVKRSKLGNYTLEAFVSELNAILSGGGNTYNGDAELLQEYKKKYEDELSRSAEYRRYIDEEMVTKHEYDKLMHKIDEGNEEYARLVAEKRELTEKYNEAFARTIEYKTKIETEMVTLRSYQELMDKYAAMEKSYTDLSDKYSKLKEEHEATVARVDDGRDEALIKLQQELRTEKAVTEKAIADYENVVAMLDRERFDAKGTLEKLQLDLKASKILIDSVTEKGRTLAAENEELKAKVRELELSAEQRKAIKGVLDGAQEKLRQHIEGTMTNSSEVAECSISTKNGEVTKKKGRGRVKGERNEPWVELGISRSTYYRRRNAGELK